MHAYLYNNERYSIFQIGEMKIKFKTSPYLQKYIQIVKWNNGYIECLAKYSTLSEPVEDYIDLRFIASRLELSEDVFSCIDEVYVK